MGIIGLKQDIHQVRRLLSDFSFPVDAQVQSTDYRSVQDAKLTLYYVLGQARDRLMVCGTMV